MVPRLRGYLPFLLAILGWLFPVIGLFAGTVRKDSTGLPVPTAWALLFWTAGALAAAGSIYFASERHLNARAFAQSISRLLAGAFFGATGMALALFWTLWFR